MKNESFEKKVHSIDWSKYLTSKYHDPEKMSYKPERTIKALIHLSRYNEDESPPELGAGISSEVRFAIGNDHRGTYYPAALEAIDLIIEIEKYSELESARKCAYWILNDLNYFQLEMSDDDEQLYTETASIIKQKLLPYSDETLPK